MNDAPRAPLPVLPLLVALMSIVLSPAPSALAASESTVVIRVLSSGPGFGQEPIPGWPSASPVKDAPGYSLYDLEIGSGGSNVPSYLTLYKFTGWQNSMLSLPVDQFNQYRTASSLRSIPILSSASAAPNSAQVRGALQDLVGLVLQRERATRLVIYYSGHGSPNTFFGGDISNADAQSFLAFVRQNASGMPLILDLSTNCDAGYFDLAVRYYPDVDYLIASEKLVGGFDPASPGPVEAWLASQHDNNLHRFWQSANSPEQAFDAMIAARQNVWQTGRTSIASGHVEQSLAVYKLGEFDGFMSALAKIGGFNPAVDLQRNSFDIATYVYGINNTALIALLERFRIRYVSDRTVIAWTDNSLGFSVSDVTTLQNYLTSLKSDTQPPTIPTGLFARATGTDAINLSWTASTDNVRVSAYKVYRNGGLVAALGRGTSYNDTSPTAATALYTVAACDPSTNCSVQSAPAFVGGGSPTLEAPTDLAATASGSTVTLMWTAPATGVTPTSYTLEAGSAAGLADLANFSTGTTATSFSTTGVYPGTYYVRVRAATATAVSAPSPDAILRVGVNGPCAGAPGAPGDLRVLSVSANTVSLAWSAAAGEPNSYIVQAGSSPNGSNLANSDLGSTALSLTANGVGAGTYYVRLLAKNACGTGPASNEITLVVGAGALGGMRFNP